jgi:hypothetical protein
MEQYILTQNGPIVLLCTVQPLTDSDLKQVVIQTCIKYLTIWSWLCGDSMTVAVPDDAKLASNIDYDSNSDCDYVP